MPSLWFYLRERNKYFVLIKNLPAKLLFICLPLIVIHEGLCLVKAVFRGYPVSYVRALRDVIRDLPRLLRIRSEIQARRNVKDAYVRNLMCFKDPIWIGFYRIGSWIEK
jgi:hypothetical protein